MGSNSKFSCERERLKKVRLSSEAKLYRADSIGHAARMVMRIEKSGRKVEGFSIWASEGTRYFVRVYRHEPSGAKGEEATTAHQEAQTATREGGS